MAKNRRGSSNERREHDSRYVKLEHWMLNSPAWQASDPVERALYVEMSKRFNGHNNGQIPMSQREAQRLLNVSNKPVMRAFRGLIEKGFIKEAVKGSFDWKRTDGRLGRSTRWLLTEHAANYPMPSITGTKDFMRWRPPDKPAQKKTRYAKGTSLACLEHAICVEQVC